jgi:hypothetical protein
VLRSRSGNGIWRGQDWCASIGAYGTKVQNRLLRRRRFEFLPLWGPFEGTLLGLEFESNSQNSDDRYKYRRVFLFARHPNHLMCEQRGNDILRRHDLLTQAAVEMAGEDGLAHPDLFAQKLWKRDDPRRAMILKEVREINLQIELSRQPQSVSMRSVQSSAPNESRNLTWATLFDETETHSNLQLADKVLPDALKVWDGTLKPFLSWEHPSDLPMPILRWIQGMLRDSTIWQYHFLTVLSWHRRSDTINRRPH